MVKLIKAPENLRIKQKYLFCTKIRGFPLCLEQEDNDDDFEQPKTENGSCLSDFDLPFVTPQWDVDLEPDGIDSSVKLSNLHVYLDGIAKFHLQNSIGISGLSRIADG